MRTVRHGYHDGGRKTWPWKFSEIFLQITWLISVVSIIVDVDNKAIKLIDASHNLFHCRLSLRKRGTTI